MQRIKIMNILGKKCIKCGYSDIRAIAIDHINGGGSKERNLAGGSYYSFVLKKLKKDAKDYQLLCYNCNQIKKIENNEERYRKY